MLTKANKKDVLQEAKRIYDVAIFWLHSYARIQEEGDEPSGMAFLEARSVLAGLRNAMEIVGAGDVSKKIDKMYRDLGQMARGTKPLPPE